MSAFVVLVHPESKDELGEAIESAYPGSQHYKFDDTTFLITGDLLTRDITDALKIGDNDERPAAVLKLNGSYSGHSFASLWEWVKDSERV